MATERPVGRQLLLYMATVLGSLLITYLSLKLLVEVVGLWPTPAKFVTTAITSVYSYLVSRTITFK